MQTALTAFDHTVANGGHTWGYNETPTHGYMVSFPMTEQTVPRAEFTPQTIVDYVNGHWGIVNKGAMSFYGTWINEGVVYLDVSKWIADKNEALRLARSFNQLAVYELHTGNTITL